MKGRKGKGQKMGAANIFYTPDNSVKKWIIRGVAGLAVIAIVITGVVFINREASQQASQAPAESAQVTLTMDGIDAPDLQVKKNQSVVWESQDVTEHQLAMSSESPAAIGFGSNARLSTGQSYSYVFDEPGTYHYYDTLNPTLQGKVTVTD